MAWHTGGGTLRLGAAGEQEDTGQANEGRSGTSEGVAQQEKRGAQYWDPGAGDEVGGPSFRGGTSFHCGDQVAHRAGLVRQLVRNQGPFGGVHHRTQDVVAALVRTTLPSSSCLYSNKVPAESRIGIRAGSARPSATTIRRTPASFNASAWATASGKRVVGFSVGE